jgi:heat shock protein HslJ
MVLNPGRAVRSAPDFWTENLSDMKRIITAILISLMTMTCISCASKVELNGEWAITSVGTDEITASESVPTLSFNSETGRIHGYTGINIVNGNYSHEGRKLSLSGLGVTMMAGPADEMALERKILDAFNATRSVKMSDEGELLLMDGDGNEIMTLARK